VRPLKNTWLNSIATLAATQTAATGRSQATARPPPRGAAAPNRKKPIGMNSRMLLTKSVPDAAASDTNGVSRKIFRPSRSGTR